jgi:hypothetical protein
MAVGSQRSPHEVLNLNAFVVGKKEKAIKKILVFITTEMFRKLISWRRRKVNRRVTHVLSVLVIRFSPCADVSHIVRNRRHWGSRRYGSDNPFYSSGS